MDLQIDDFYKDCATGLLQLYQAFPRRIALYVEDLIGPSEPDEFGLPSKRHESCLGALLWLADEGYLRFDSTIRFEALDQAVLTEKGFLRLSRTLPGVLDGRETLPASILRVRASLAQQLRDAIRNADSEHLVRVTRLIFVSGTDASDDIV
ncbi:hypothetical protein [Metapseudomonas resinovorans]|uniref:Uncharacterized protein n=1 Tax=Metapseudomonas resinovorans NBRC 106553 TaxID=1245471 RepID=S6AG14_METRE|nr:hypothetical protein [Pseudomonas resinovorans]BAN49072.1 hypothetical protein PCA10_33400 [Pseudomonas resinovorans NBRC 106553]